MFAKKTMLATTFLVASMVTSVTTATTLARPNFSTPNSDWQVTVAPYLWAINMNGAVTVSHYRTPMDESFDELLKHLNFAGMLWLDASKDDFSVFLNVIYTVLRYNTSDSFASLHAKNRLGLTSGGLAYQVFHNNFVGISPYAGFRYTSNDTTVTVNASGLDVTVLNNQYWTDPIVGARFNFALSKDWSAIVAGDVGGMNASSQYSYNVYALLGYSPESHWTNTSLYVGYRLLDQNYSTGSGINYFHWNMKLFGPIAGIAIKF